MAKKIQVELTTDQAQALLASRSETRSKEAERALDDAQLKLADEMLKARHGR